MRNSPLAWFAAAGAVFAGSISNAIAAYESCSDGSQRQKVFQWRSDVHRTGYQNVTLHFDDALPSLLVRHEGLNKGVHTAAKSSPVVLDDGTFLQAGDTGILYRLRLDGSVVWAAAQQRFSSFGYHSTPCVVYRGDGADDDDVPDLVIIGSYDGVLSAFDLVTGQIVWENTKDMGQHIGSSPACTEDAVYISVEFSTPKAAGGVCKVDISNGEAIWCSYTMTGHSHSPPAVDFDLNVVVAGANDGHLHVFQETDGQKIAEYRLGQKREGQVKGAILLWKGVAIFGSWASKIHAVDLNGIEERAFLPDGTLSLQTDAVKHWGSYVPVGDGKKAMSSAAIDPETEKVYIGAHDRIMRCIDFHSGKVLWEYETGDYILSSPVVLKNAVVFGSSDGHVYALRKGDGSLLWDFLEQRTGRITSSVGVTADGTTLVFASDSYGFTSKNSCKGKPGSLHIIGVKRENKKSSSVRDEYIDES